MIASLLLRAAQTHRYVFCFTAAKEAKVYKRTMRTSADPPLPEPSPIENARVAIWRLFQEGYVDEDMATASLLAVDVGTRRARGRGTQPQQPHGVRNVDTAPADRGLSISN
jgi:hypothetical protein